MIYIKNLYRISSLFTIYVLEGLRIRELTGSLEVSKVVLSEICNADTIQTRVWIDEGVGSAAVLLQNRRH